MSLLIVFLLRLTLGLTAAMALVSHRQVSSGYFRNHLYVALGLATLAALLCRWQAPAAFWYAVAAAVVSYAGVVAWLYEAPRVGKTALVLVALAALAGLMAVENGAATDADAGVGSTPELARVLRTIQPLSSSLLLGSTLAAMLLGHWYLNAPGMQLAPLRSLLAAMALAVSMHAAVCGLGLWNEAQQGATLSLQWQLFVVLRWSFGLAALGGLIFMAWQTLKIPNTQSATGILYVAVIGSFTGEIMSQVLSAASTYPI